MARAPETCYACDAPATSREHVPPLCLFPEVKDRTDGLDMRQKLITVPSCAEHNQGKSNDDLYFVMALCLSITANDVALGQVTTKLLRSIKRDPTLWRQFSEGSFDAPIIDSQSGRQVMARAMPLDPDRFLRVLELIARGIYFHSFGRRWQGEVMAHVDFVEDIDDDNRRARLRLRLRIFELARSVFESASWEGANPDVFRYAIWEEPALRAAMIRFVFLGNCTATAVFHDGLVG